MGSGVRIYLARTLTLMGIYGEGLRSMGGVMEFSQCTAVESGGSFYVAATPNCWRLDSEEIGGEMFGKMHFWEYDGGFFREPKEEGGLEEKLKKMGGHCAKTFADKMLQIPTTLGMQQVAWSGRQLFGLGCGGR